jgi:hypothetical protein
LRSPALPGLSLIFSRQLPSRRTFYPGPVQSAPRLNAGQTFFAADPQVRHGAAEIRLGVSSLFFSYRKSDDSLGFIGGQPRDFVI